MPTPREGRWRSAAGAWRAAPSIQPLAGVDHAGVPYRSAPGRAGYARVLGHRPSPRISDHPPEASFSLSSEKLSAPPCAACGPRTDGDPEDGGTEALDLRVGVPSCGRIQVGRHCGFVRFPGRPHRAAAKSTRQPDDAFLAAHVRLVVLSGRSLLAAAAGVPWP